MPENYDDELSVGAFIVLALFFAAAILTCVSFALLAGWLG